MDEEESFAKLLSQSTSAAAPSWNATQADDPWANPFSDSTPSSNPFGSPFGTSSVYVPAPISDPYAAPLVTPETPREEVSPYVTKIEEDEAEALGQRPDPPSVIAAREQASQFEPTSTYESESFRPDEGYPGASSVPSSQVDPQKQVEPVKKGLPSDLIDEDLLAASDPSASLKKAFVKSAPSAARKETKGENKAESKAYVFTPGRKGGAKGMVKKAEEVPVAEEKRIEGDQVEGQDPRGKGEHKTEQEKQSEAKGADEPVPEKDTLPSETTSAADNTNGTAPAQQTDSTTAEEPVLPAPPQDDQKPADKPAAIPLPESNEPTPTTTRPTSPVVPASPARSKSSAATIDEVEPSPSVPFTPSIDRVAVSPLDAVPQQPDYGFQSLSIGASSIAPPPPPKSPVRADSDGWAGKATSPPGSRFAGKGWGAIDEDEGGLFGKGGPSVRSATTDPWGSSSSSNDTGEGGWGEPGMASLPSPPRNDGPSTVCFRRRRTSEN